MKLALAIISLGIGISAQAQDIYSHDHSSRTYASVAVNPKVQVLVPASAVDGSVGKPVAPVTMTLPDTINTSGLGGAVTGMIVDSVTRKPIAGVEVSIQGTHTGARTNETGRFVLANVTPGPHVLQFRLLGYRGITRPVTVNADQVVDGNVALAPVNTELTRVIVTGTVIGTQEKAIPTTITVVTAEDIVKRGITQIDQLFRGSVPGVVALNTGMSDDNAVKMFSRGATDVAFQTSTTPFKTYIDGVEVSNSSYINSIDVNSIDHIEILTGPQGSTVYGSNSLNGVMQIFTKRGAEKPVVVTAGIGASGSQSSYASGLAPSYNTNLQLTGTQASGFSYLGSISGRYNGSSIPGRHQTSFNGNAGAHQQIKWLSMDGSLYATNQLTAGSLGGILGGSQGYAQYFYGGLNKFFPANLIQRSNSTVVKTEGASGTLVASIFPWWTQQAVVGRNTTDLANKQNAPFYLTPDDSLNHLFDESQTVLQMSYNTTVRGSLANFTDLTITAGFDGTNSSYQEFEGDATNLTNSFAVVNTAVAFNLDRARGGFLQAQAAIHDIVFLTYGLRGEYNSLYGGRYGISYTPRYGISVVAPIGEITAKFRAAYGQGTRPPDRGEVGPIYSFDKNYGGVFPLVKESPHLGPESQRGSEGGIDLFLGSLASVSVTAYHQTIEHALVSFQVDTLYSLIIPFYRVYSQQYFNIGRVRNSGAELTGNINLGVLTLHGVYSFTKSRIVQVTDSANGLDIVGVGYLKSVPGSAFGNLPEHTWSLDMGYSVAKTTAHFFVNGISRFNASGSAYNTLNTIGENRLTSSGPTRVYTDYPNAYYVAPAYSIFGMKFDHQIRRSLTAVFQMDNIGNRFQNDFSAGTPTTGRLTSLGLRVRL